MYLLYSNFIQFHCILYSYKKKCHALFVYICLFCLIHFNPVLVFILPIPMIWKHNTLRVVLKTSIIYNTRMKIYIYLYALLIYNIYKVYAVSIFLYEKFQCIWYIMASELKNNNILCNKRLEFFLKKKVSGFQSFTMDSHWSGRLLLNLKMQKKI